MTRFVILHHQAAGGEHWDFMLEHEGVLLTWQLLADPRTVESLPIAARRIGNHRLAYLDYEGPISGNRGEVCRVDAGEVQILGLSETHCRFTLHGEKLVGVFQLVGCNDGWSFEVDPHDS